MEEDMGDVEKITEILLRLSNDLRRGDLSDSERAFLAQASCTELARAQQNMLESGVTIEQLWLMWQRNRKILPDQASKLRSELPGNHVLLRTLAEHETIICFAADLMEINNQIQQLDFASSATQEIRRLAQISGHLVSAHEHSEREEDIIYPEIRKHGFHDLLQIANDQHQKMISAHRKLKELVWQVDKMDFDIFKAQLDACVDFIVPTLQTHIFIETNIIFSVAIEVIDDRRIWRRMKKVCDLIGYCDYDMQ